VKNNSLVVLSIAALLGTFAGSCSQAPTTKPYDAVVVDKSDPHHMIVEFDGACADSVKQGKYDVKGRKEYSVTENDKTYYFSTASARNDFMRDYADNSRLAEQMWASRELPEGSPVVR
jgi:hypothetical protein